MDTEPNNPGLDIDLSHDSVRLLGNDERVKCMVVIDVTDMTVEQRKTFVDRALPALTRMGTKVIERRSSQN